MIYFSNKKKIADLLQEVIIPALKKKDLDYEKCITAIMKETNASRNVVEEVIRAHIPSEMQEIHLLTLPDKKIEGLLQELRKEEEEINKELKEAGL